MSSGRKKVSTPAIDAPPPITSYNFTSPTGDSYSTSRQHGVESTTSTLTPRTQSTIDSSMSALNTLASELNTPDPRRTEDIWQRSRDFYDLQAQNIHQEANQLFSQASSDLSKRFGGTYNATFGTDYLARLEGNRLNQLYNAGKEAALLGEDLYTQDENSRMQRFVLFQNYLSNEFNKASGLGSTATSMLQNEANRAQDLAIQRAQLLQRAQEVNANLALQRSKLASNILSVAAGRLPRP